jgi:hypothetical protein
MDHSLLTCTPKTSTGLAKWSIDIKNPEITVASIDINQQRLPGVANGDLGGIQRFLVYEYSSLSTSCNACLVSIPLGYRDMDDFLRQSDRTQQIMPSRRKPELDEVFIFMKS